MPDRKKEGKRAKKKDSPEALGLAGKGAPPFGPRLFLSILMRIGKPRHRDEEHHPSRGKGHHRCSPCRCAWAPEGERAAVKRRSGGASLPPRGWFFVSMPRLADAHRDREEQARPERQRSFAGKPEGLW